MSLSTDDNINTTNNINNINNSDILNHFNDIFIDLSHVKKEYYKVITSIKIPEQVKLIGKIDTFDLWKDLKHNILLIAFPNSPIKSWYKIKTIDDINIFLDYFNSINNFSYTNEIKLYISNSITFDYLIKLIYFNDFIEKMLYLDLSDYKQNRMKKINNNDKIKILDTFFNKESFIVVTEYSKSVLEFLLINNIIIVNIYYNKFNLRNRYCNIDKYIPSDIDIVLNNLSLHNYSDLLTQNITIKNLEICEILLNNNKLLYKDILLKLLKEDLDSNILEYINKKYNEIDIDIIFNKIDKDGTLKAFENSLDILLKTLYEKLSLPETNYDLNINYINDKIKNKINNILLNKLI